MEHIQLFKSRVSAAIKQLRDEEKLDKFNEVYEAAENVIVHELRSRTANHDLTDIISEVIGKLKTGYKEVTKLPDSVGFSSLVTEVLEHHTEAFNKDELTDLLDKYDDGMEIYILKSIDSLDELDIQKAYLAGILIFNYVMVGLGKDHLLINRYMNHLRLGS